MSAVSPDSGVTPFAPPPGAGELPAVFPSPFDGVGPHPLARRAAEEVQAVLRSGQVAPGVDAAVLDAPEGGKMFGVLVVQAADGTVGYLRAFSSMLAGQWYLPGFVPPAFDVARREAIEPRGDGCVKALIARAAAFERDPQLVEARATDETQKARHTEELHTLRARHEALRAARHLGRAALDAQPDTESTRAARHALDQESRRDKAERRRLEQTHAQERHAVAQVRARLERRLAAHHRLRRIVCRSLMQQLQDCYEMPNACGRSRPLRALYPNGAPPSGAGDCAAPRLLAHAFRHGLRPLALAEFWWGAPPSGGGRVSGAFYPACRDKCGPLLPFMLEGLDVAAPRHFKIPTAPLTPLPVVYQDAWIVVVDKPEGMLSVPARDVSVTDSMLARLRAAFPGAGGPLLVHRLDLDTSGLLVAALDRQSHRTLQRQFAERTVEKRYIALVSGQVVGDRGEISLPLRVDLDDRPRQIHDPVHGRIAVTHWQVLDRRPLHTRVALFPRTGRTHQLRVHAAHPLGLGTPIVGDRLYGHPGPRLCLHAEALSFRHPHTGQIVSFEKPAPF